MTEKIIGYLLLSAGLLVMVFSSVNLLLVFAGKAEPVQLFHFNSVSLDLGQMLSAQLPAAARSGIQTTTAPAELIPADMINQISNVTIHLFLMGFLVSVGQKIASLGVELLRPVTIKVKGKEEIPAEKE